MRKLKKEDRVLIHLDLQSKFKANLNTKETLLQNLKRKKEEKREMGVRAVASGSTPA